MGCEPAKYDRRNSRCEATTGRSYGTGCCGCFFVLICKRVDVAGAAGRGAQSVAGRSVGRLGWSRGEEKSVGEKRQRARVVLAPRGEFDGERAMVE